MEMDIAGQRCLSCRCEAVESSFRGCFPTSPNDVLRAYSSLQRMLFLFPEQILVCTKSIVF